MFVLFLFTLTASSALNLTQFEHFKIDLEPKSIEYFLFHGKQDYAYFYQKNGQFELWVTQLNDSYAIYTAPYSDFLRFEWPDKLINDKPMNKILYEGEVVYPLKFDTEFFMSNVYGVTAGTLNYKEPVLELFKCPPTKSWIINVIVCLVALLLILLGVKHETVKALLGPKFSWLVHWRRPVLSRSSETSSSDDSKTDCTVSENSKSLHFA